VKTHSWTIEGRQREAALRKKKGTKAGAHRNKKSDGVGFQTKKEPSTEGTVMESKGSKTEEGDAPERGREEGGTSRLLHE